MVMASGWESDIRILAPPVVMGSGQKFLAWVGLVQASQLWVWKISPKIPIFPSGSKKSHRFRSKNIRVGHLIILRVKSMLGPCRSGHLDLRLPKVFLYWKKLHLKGIKNVPVFCLGPTSSHILTYIVISFLSYLLPVLFNCTSCKKKKPSWQNNTHPTNHHQKKGHHSNDTHTPHTEFLFPSSWWSPTTSTTCLYVYVLNITCRRNSYRGKAKLYMHLFYCCCSYNLLL